MQSLSVRDIRPLPQCSCGLRFAGMLRGSVFGYDVSLQPIRSIFLNNLTLEDGTDGLSRNVGSQLPTQAAQYPRNAKSPTWKYLQCLFHKQHATLSSIQNKTNSFDTILSIYFNITLSFTPRSTKCFFFSSSHQNFVRISLFPHICHIPRPSYSS